VFRAIDLAAGSVQIALQVAPLGAVQSIARASIHALFRSDRRFVRSQPVQLASRQFAVLPAVSDPRGLPPLARVDTSTMMRGRVGYVLSKREHGRREHESKRRRNNASNQYVVLAFAALARHLALPD